MDAVAHGGRVGLVQVHEERRHDEEERVGHRVEELGDYGGEGVVLLTPVHGRAAAVEMRVRQQLVRHFRGPARSKRCRPV